MMNKNVRLLAAGLVVLLILVCLIPQWYPTAHASANLALGKTAVASSAKNSALAGPGGAAPERTASFGPNGTHWPSLIPTPFMYDRTVPHIVEVAASWTAIRTALSAVTPEQAGAGVLILVAPGNLPGNGAGAGNAAVLQNLGSSTWTKRVTVAPRDGYGTVTISGGAKIKNVRGVAFAGLVADQIKLEGCDRSALAWTKVTHWLAGYGLAGQTTSLMEFSEVVMPNSLVLDGDASDFYSVASGPIEGWRFDGIYIAPHFYNAASTPKPHTDSLQFAGSAAYSNMTFRDAAVFASNNCAIQVGSLYGLTLDHSYLAAGSVARSRYPFLSGGATEGGTAAFNGSGSSFAAIDSVIIGALGSSSWASVTNTRINYQATQTPATGSWTVDLTLSATNPPMPPMPDDAYLNSIWRE